MAGLRTLRTPVPPACSNFAIVMPFPALLPPASSADTPNFAKNKNAEVARRHPGGLGTELNPQSFPGCESLLSTKPPRFTRGIQILIGSDLG